MKKNQVFAFVSGLITIIAFCVLLVLLNLWYVAAAIFVFAVISSTVDSIREKKEKTCQKCKVPYDFDTDVGYKQIDRIIKNRAPHATSKPTDIAAEETYIVEFTCQCPQCNEIKKYKKKIPGAKITYNGDYQEGDPEYFIENYFVGKKKTSLGILWVINVILIALCIAVATGFFSNAFSSIASSTLGNTYQEATVEKGEDPKDYYGTYYIVQDGTILVADFSSSECVLTFVKGITDDEVYNCEYEYVSAEYAQTRFPDTNHVNCDAIFIYTDSNNKNQAVTFWVINKEGGNYQFETSVGSQSTTDKTTISDLTNDPKNYYGTYYYGNLFVTLNEDGTAVMDLGTGAINYSYLYANQEYGTKWVGTYNEKSIIVFDKNSDGVYIFSMENSNTLILADQYEFTK